MASAANTSNWKTNYPIIWLHLLCGKWLSYPKQQHVSLYFAHRWSFETLSKASKTYCIVTSSTMTVLSLDLEPVPIDTCLRFTPKTCSHQNNVTVQIHLLTIQKLKRLWCWGNRARGRYNAEIKKLWCKSNYINNNMRPTTRNPTPDVKWPLQYV